MAKNKNRAATLAIDGQVIAGVKKDLQSVSQLPLGGEIYTAASVVAFLQSRIDAANAVAIAKAQYAAALAAYDAINTKGTGVVTGLRQYVMNAYGKSSPMLADFGFVPPKVTVLTADQKAAAAAKRLATRLARGTVGPKKKLAVTGETVKLAALQANQQPAAPVAAPTAARVPTPAPVPAPTVATAPATQPAPANGAPPAPTPPKA
jgi:hypothetical protein